MCLTRFRFLGAAAAALLLALQVELLTTSAFAQSGQPTFTPEVQRSAPKPENKLAKPGEKEKKEKDAVARAQGQPHGYWITNRGAFRTLGAWGKGIYKWGDYYDTTWTFSDARDVGGRSGWTFKENGYNFWVFFPEHAPGPHGCPHGTLMASENNEWFEPFACILPVD